MISAYVSEDGKAAFLAIRDNVARMRSNVIAINFVRMVRLYAAGTGMDFLIDGPKTAKRTFLFAHGAHQ